MSPDSSQHSSADTTALPHRFHDLEDVVLLCDVPDKGLKSGEAGTIVHVFDIAQDAAEEASEAYYVEFTHEDGSTRALVAVTADQIRAEAP